MKANDIRKGSVLMYNKAPHKVMDFHHHTPGNLRAMVQTKLRNLLSGSQTEVRFSSTEDIEEADVHTCGATYLYSDLSGYHFMRADTYEEVSLSAEKLGEAAYYIQDQMEVSVTLYAGDPIGVELPTTVILEIGETEPEVKNSTASDSPKTAKTTTGLQISVPPFVKVGDKIIVNTLESRYISRAD